MKESKLKMTFEYCPSCSGDLDTGWECNNCGRDWMDWAIPWFEKFKYRFFKKRYFKEID